MEKSTALAQQESERDRQLIDLLVLLLPNHIAKHMAINEFVVRAPIGVQMGAVMGAVKGAVKGAAKSKAESARRSEAASALLRSAESAAWRRAMSCLGCHATKRARCSTDVKATVLLNAGPVPKCSAASF